MWHALRISVESDPGFVSSVTDLLRSTSRNVIFITGGVCLAWQFLIADEVGRHLGLTFLPLTGIVISSCVLALWLLREHYLVAQAAWHLGIMTAITLVIYWFRVPEAAFLYALLPLMASVTLSWPAGLLAEGLVIGLVLGIGPGLGWISLSRGYAVAIVVGGMFTGLLGGAATQTLLTVTQWSLFSFEQARRKMDEARDRQVELRQVQEDLIQANKELARLSDQLKAMYRVAEEARRAKEEFVANVSHELRTPLNMIIGFSEMITESPQVYGDKLPPALLADIAVIQRNSQHLAKLVDDVLDLSQIEAGRMALSKEWASLYEIVGEATQIVEPLFKSKGLSLEAELPPDLPAIFCDRTRIRQVVINLLSNAGRFTDQGGAWVRVWREEDRVMISVSDTGPGISPADRDRLFEPFQQADSFLRRRCGGSGLGLSISKRFVEMHGGRIWIESPLPEEVLRDRGGIDRGGAGTMITFSLPIEPVLPVSTARAGDGVSRWFSPYSRYEYRIRTRRSKAPAPVVVPRFVLLERGKMLQRLFSRYADDVEIVAVRSVEEAIRALRRSPARALIVNASPFEDISMAVEQLADLPYGIPVMSCWVPGEDEAAKQLGVARYLLKPITRGKLLSALEDLGRDVRTVLLVDDEPGQLQLFTRMLSATQRTYRVLQAKSGQQALHLLRQRHPDVMLLDLIMPGKDGFRVLQEKSLDPTIRD
ncbi:MAG: hybrid sensor histidine kinase/response regulator, partial [Anaerolineae bacterium]|nr:hybrid sensor histidine kinase/response regulator [Anaerolineae bacterium]